MPVPLTRPRRVPSFCLPQKERLVSDSTRLRVFKSVPGTSPRYAAYMPRGLSASHPDVQAQAPSLRVSLSRAGVTEIEKIVRIRQHGEEQLFSARLQCFVDLGPQQKGAHMSRFEEVVNEVIGEVVLGEAGFKAEALATRIAELVRERQDAKRAEVTIAARYPEHKPAPVSGIPTQEIYTLYGMAVASAAGTPRPGRGAAPGLTALPGAPPPPL